MNSEGEKCSGIAALSARQREILQSAGELITESGINGFTMRALASKIGFGESALYRHFKSKEDIVVAMIGLLCENTNERLNKIIRRDMNESENLKNILVSQVRFFRDNSFYAAAVFSDGLYAEEGRVRQAMQILMQNMISHLRPVIVRAQRTGEFNSDVSTEHIVHFIMGAFRFQMLKWRMAGMGFDPEGKMRLLAESLVLILNQKNET